MTSNVKIQVMLPYKLGLAIEYTREPDYMPEKVFEGLYHLLVACTPSTDATDIYLLHVIYLLHALHSIN